MFLKYKVDIPVVPGKLVRKNRGGHTYIEKTRVVLRTAGGNMLTGMMYTVRQ